MQLNAEAIQGLKHPGNARALRLLEKMTELLTMYGVGAPIEGTTVRPTTKSVTSLCSSIMDLRLAWWDSNGEDKSKHFIVGGHGVCKGHCGAGCPTSGGVNYTQDCFNHDACVGEENGCAACGWGVCGDEWWSAVDDWASDPC